MLRRSDDVPYASKLVTFIYKKDGEWHFTNSKREKAELLDSNPVELMCTWTGDYSTDIFEVDKNKAWCQCA